MGNVRSKFEEGLIRIGLGNVDAGFSPQQRKDRKKQLRLISKITKNRSRKYTKVWKHQN